MKRLHCATQVGNTSVLDLSLREEACSRCALHVAVSGPWPSSFSRIKSKPFYLQVNAKGRICGVTKEGQSGVDPSMLTAMIETAQRAGPKLITSLSKFICSGL